MRRRCCCSSRSAARPVLRLVRDLGVRDQPDVPSLALGSGLVTPLELTAAYAVFPTLGYRVRPRGLDVGRERDRRHRASRACRARAHPPRADRVPDGDDASGRRRSRHRSGRASVRRQGPIGGKTGSTNDYRDAWFVGFSSSVVAGVWVGFDQPESIREGGSGARVALPIWSDFMRRRAPAAAGAVACHRPICRAKSCVSLSYQRPVDGCPTYTEHFKQGDEIPARLCSHPPGHVQAKRATCDSGFLRAHG